jgi:hypothetical protein
MPFFPTNASSDADSIFDVDDFDSGKNKTVTLEVNKKKSKHVLLGWVIKVENFNVAMHFGH